MKRLNFKFLISILLFSVMRSVSADILVGGLPGDINVDNTGEATYSIPLSLPPGTAGMAPTLGIAYSSNGGNGILGLGFSLSGLSGISRAPATRLHDGVIDGVNFNHLDRLVLDGQRLVLVSNGAYGASGSEYRTEIESFSRVVLHGNMNSAGSWFEVRTKSGLIYEYGNTSDSFVEAEGRTQALFWAVSKIRDTAGNYITFHYSENANEPHLLTGIVYTGNAGQGLSPCNSIDFVYENRSDTRSGWLAGSKTVSNKRLQKIVINGAAGYITDYRFTYEYNETGISLLKSVQQFFGADSTPPTRFEYTRKTSPDLFNYISGTAFIPEGAADSVYRDMNPQRVDSGDFNGDGLIDFVRLDNKNDPKFSWIALAEGAGSFLYTSGTNFIPFGTSTNVFRNGKMQTLMPDFNGDGLSDILSISPNNTSEKSWMGLSNGDGTFTYMNGTAFIPNGSLGNVFRNENTSVMPGDFNGDGLADIVSVHQNNDARYSWIGLSNGDGTFVYHSGTNFIPNGSLNNVFRNQNMSVITGDFNGDGLTDIASVHPNSDARYSWIGLSNGDGTFQYISGTAFIPNGSAGNVYRGTNTRVITGDFNGDGMTDIASVHPNNLANRSWIGLSKGDGTFHYISGTAFIPNGSLNNVYRGDYTAAFAADVNGDGLADLVSVYPGNNAGRSWVGFSNGDGTFEFVNGTDFIPEGDLNSVYRDVYTSVTAGDFNGDGMLDIASIYPGNSAAKSWIALNQYNRCFLSKVTKGYRSEDRHGSVTEIEYLPITDNLIYSKGAEAVYPIYDVQAPIYVVSALSKDNGIGGKYWSDYTYADARTHRDRGFLGFRVFESYDRQTRLSQVEILAQDFPHTGSSLRQETYYFPDPNNSDTKQLLKEVSNTYLYDRVNHGGTSTNYSIFSYVAKSVERKWELGQTNAPMTEVSSYNWFDNQPLVHDVPRLVQTNELGAIIAPAQITYGNITKIVMDYGDGSKQISSNSYFDVNINTWLLGRLATSTVTHVLSGKLPVTRTSCFDYDAVSGLLRRETVEPARETLKLTTDYAYDGFGNITNKMVSAPGIATRSVQQSDYAAGGRFVSASRNTLNHGETYQYDQNTGLVTAKTGPNGLTTSMEYDALGRAVRENRADGTVTTTEYAWLDNTVVSVPDPLNPGSHLTSKVSYRVTTQSSGSAPITVWYDHQGRELRRIGLSPSGKKVCQDIGYNRLGQSVMVSEGYFSGEEIKYTRTEYDVLGRVHYVTGPDGTVMETIYNGLTTQTIADSSRRSGSGADAPKDQTKTVIQNAKGQILEVIDNLGKSLLYEYDAVGNLTATVAGGTAPGSVRTEMEYDLLGKKIRQIDPDMGEWSYAYNALGEMISQTDAKGQTTAMEYDTLGRMVKRTTPEGEARWFYDGTDAGCWLGALRREELRDGQGNLTYRKTYAYDSLGRPMLELYNFDNKWYYNCVRYDQYSRVKFTDRFWRPKDIAAAGNNLSPLWNVLTTVNTYNHLGFVTKISDSTGHTWWQIDGRDVDSKGRLLKYALGNGTVTSKTYDSNTGFLTAIQSRNAASEYDDIQNQLYTFDRLGNITSRRDLRQIYLKETFVNDGLNRLTSSTVESSLTNSTVSTVSYDFLGNILTKSGVGTYTYGSSKPHAVTQVTDNGSLITDYSYDANGNMASRSVEGSDTLTTAWTSFNMPETLFIGPNGSTFTYDINNNRITQIIETDDGISRTVKKKIYIAGMEQDEEVTNPGEQNESLWNWNHKETRIFISTPSGVVGMYVETPSSEPSAPCSITRKYFHTDHLGSVVAVTGAKVGDTAAILAEYSFDAWGARRDAADWSPLSQPQTANLQPQTDRGFTGHEMLDHLGFIHMNGRIYDATLGRFLSADPTLQFPDNLQNHNRYTYVGNNPLRYTDPSGYFWNPLKTWKKIGSFFKKYWKVIVVIVIAVVVTWLTWGLMTSSVVGWGAGWAAGAVAGAAGGFAGGFAGTLLNGGTLSQAFKAGLEGAAWGAVAGAAGGYIQGLQIAKWEVFCKSLAGGVAGSAISFAQGGSIESGFLAGFAGGMVGGYLKTDNLGYKMLAGAIVGGCASVVGGGKFEAGAVTGAFVALTTALASKIEQNWTGQDKLAAKYAEQVRTDNTGGLLASKGISYSDNDGLGVALYLGDDGVYYGAFRQTQPSSGKDWWANFKQGFGCTTSQYEQTVDLAKQMYAETGGNIVFVGHSLGGGLASAAAHATGANAITFNAAGLNNHYNTGGAGNIRAHYVRGDILSTLQDATLMPNAAGTRIMHGASSWYKGPIGRHGMGNFL